MFLSLMGRYHAGSRRDVGRAFGALITLTGALLAAPLAANAQIVTNGGFETGDFSGWTLVGNQSPNGGLPADGVGHTGFFGDPPHNGNFVAWFGQVGSLGGISQDVTLTPGDEYNLRYFLLNDGGTPSEFQMALNNVVDTDYVDPPAFGYTELGFNFLATAATTNLTFEFRQDPFEFTIDDISITPGTGPLGQVGSIGAPEPSSIAMLLASVPLGLVIVRRRRRAAAAQ
jgi:hypothetical protein